ncbi:MAG: hypothetical protein R3200_09225 [Xanthomonadales bacterium]|nr:hypothetical protein [Xanthomonadales bacterium]
MFRFMAIAVLAVGSAQARDYLIEAGDVAGLVAAVELANEAPGPDRIFLSPRATYVFESPAPGHPHLALPPIRDDLDLVGNRATLRRYSDHPFSHIEVSRSARLRLVAVTLADGADGSLRNFGELLLWHAIVEDNAGGGTHAALVNFGTARVLDSRIRFNSFSSTGRFGGAVVNFGSLEMVDSAMYGNSAYGSVGTIEMGAALSNFGTCELRGVTINAHQTSQGQVGAGAIANFFPGRLQMTDSVVEANLPAAIAEVPGDGIGESTGTRFAR